MAGSATNQTAQERIQTQSRGKVLLVDDELQDLQCYDAFLCARGYDVLTCASYAEGAHYLQHEVFDFVVVSQGSRFFEGRPVLRLVIEIDRYIPVLVLARCLDMNCYLEAMQLGAVDYIEKPVPPEQLLWVIETHLRRSSKAT